jgi:hypothetical protein
MKRSLWCSLLLLCAFWAVGAAEAKAPAKIEVVGSFSNVKHTHEDAFGYVVKLWKRGNQLFGLFLVYSGPPADPPTGILENIKFNPQTRQLSFSARLSTGVVYSREYSGVPSRDRFTFEGVLTLRQVSGSLTRSNDLFPHQESTSERIRLRRSESLTQLMLPPPPTYPAWKTSADEILRRLGPKW